MFRSHWLRLMALALMACSPAVSRADDTAACEPCASPCGDGVTYVERKVCVPTWTTETRKVMVTEYKTEQQERTRTIYERVPVQVEQERTYTVMVPEQHTKQVKYYVCVPTVHQVEQKYYVCVPNRKQVEQTYTVMVPHVEERTGTRMVCEAYQEQVMRKVTRDLGHWETQTVEVPCATVSACDSGCHRSVRRGLFRRRCGRGCSPCVSTSCCSPCGTSECAPATRTVCKRVWVPNVVTEEVPCTVTRYRQVPQEYKYHVTVCKPEQRTRSVTVCHYTREERTRTVNVTRYHREERTKDVTYTVCVPHQKTDKVMVTTYKCEPKEITETVTVCVPHQVEKEVEVKVCKMVEQIVQVAVEKACGEDYVARCCRPRRCGLFAGCGLLR